MMNLSVFKRCPVCSIEVFELFSTGTLKLGNEKIDAICFECFEGLLDDNLLVNCIRCNSEDTILKKKTYEIGFGNQKAKTFAEVVYCTECELEFETDELLEQQQYRETVLFKKMQNKQKKLKRKKK